MAAALHERANINIVLGVHHMRCFQCKCCRYLAHFDFSWTHHAQIVHSVVVTNAMSAAVNVQVSVAVQRWKVDSACFMNDHGTSGRCTGMTSDWA